MSADGLAAELYAAFNTNSQAVVNGLMQAAALVEAAPEITWQPTDVAELLRTLASTVAVTSEEHYGVLREDVE